MVQILDVGCGLGDMGLAILRWAEKKGRSVEVTGVEKAPAVAALAEKFLAGVPGIKIIRGDILEDSLPMPQYDVVINSLLLHHIPQERQADFLLKSDSIALQGIILSDLERSTLGYCAVKALSWLIGGPVVRHDGPLSVRRALTLDELENLAQRCALPYLRARPEPFFRVSLSGEKAR